MSLVSNEGDSEQNEIRTLQEKLESTMSLVKQLSGQLAELKEQVSEPEPPATVPSCAVLCEQGLPHSVERHPTLWRDPFAIGDSSYFLLGFAVPSSLERQGFTNSRHAKVLISPFIE